MPQITIDPSRRTTATGTSPIRVLPPEVRSFGYIPDLTLFKAGDLILSRSKSPSCIERQIFAVQKKIGFANEDAQWTHAAVFLYEDNILEAVPWRGVINRSFYTDLVGSIHRVRRFKNLSETDRYKIALCAQRMLGARYSKREAIMAAVSAFISPWSRVWFQNSQRTVVCSKVYFDAHVEITRHMLANCSPETLVTPAHLSATADLEDIEVPWLKVS